MLSLKQQNKLRVRRLTLLREIIVGVEEDKLHMARFIHIGAVCGTAYCAAGWAAQHPYFKRIGLRINTLSWRGGVTPFCLLGRIFLLNSENTSALFGGNLDTDAPDHCVSKQAVINNIDRLLRGERAQHYEVEY